MLRLTSDKVNSVCISEMKDGDIAVITSWSIEGYIGRVVQRYHNFLLTVGANSGSGWNEYFRDANTIPRNQVRILEKGETLVVG